MTWPHGLLLCHAQAKVTRIPDQCLSLAMSWGRPFLLLDLLFLLNTGSGGRHDDTYNTLVFLFLFLSLFSLLLLLLPRFRNSDLSPLEAPASDYSRLATVFLPILLFSSLFLSLTTFPTLASSRFHTRSLTQ